MDENQEKGITMSFILKDCPNLGPYWLAKTRGGKLAIIHCDRRGEVFGEHEGKPITFGMFGHVGDMAFTWREDGKSDGATDRTGLSGASPGRMFDLIGPWDGKHIIGWTAEELASAVRKVGSRLYDIATQNGRVSAVCSVGASDELCEAIKCVMEDTLPDLIWCKHIRWIEGRWILSWVRPGESSECQLTVEDDWDRCPIKGCHANRPRISK